MLKTDRCSIYEIKESDLADVRILFTDDEVRTYLGGAYDKARAEEKLRNIMMGIDNQGFTVRRTSDSTLLGLIEIGPYHNGMEQEISYQFAPEVWGQGYAKETTLSIAFDEAEETMYMANLAQVNKELQQELDLVKTNRFQVLGMLMRLRQICCDPRLVYEEVSQPSSKLKACMELVSSLVENDKSVLLFSNFTSMLDLIQVELQHLHIPYFRMDGSTGKEERRELVQKFQDKEKKVFLISLKSGGTGINLTAAEAVIHYDPWWNVSAENQASDRAYRIGQNSRVQVYKLIMRNTVEERIQHLQQMTKELADIFVEENETNIMRMDKDQILELLKVSG